MDTAPDPTISTAIAATDQTKATAAPRIKLLSHGFSIDHPDPELGEQLMANALGATDRDVRSLFFAEAGAMGLFGGFFGVALGWLIGSALTWGTTIYLHKQNLPSVKISYIPWWLAVGAILFAVAVSLLAAGNPVVGLQIDFDAFVVHRRCTITPRHRYRGQRLWQRWCR